MFSVLWRRRKRRNKPFIVVCVTGLTCSESQLDGVFFSPFFVRQLGRIMKNSYKSILELSTTTHTHTHSFYLYTHTLTLVAAVARPKRSMYACSSESANHALATNSKGQGSSNKCAYLKLARLREEWEWLKKRRCDDDMHSNCFVMTFRLPLFAFRSEPLRGVSQSNFLHI